MSAFFFFFQLLLNAINFVDSVRVELKKLDCITSLYILQLVILLFFFLHSAWFKGGMHSLFFFCNTPFDGD